MDTSKRLGMVAKILLLADSSEPPVRLRLCYLVGRYSLGESPGPEAVRVEFPHHEKLMGYFDEPDDGRVAEIRVLLFEDQQAKLHQTRFLVAIAASLFPGPSGFQAASEWKSSRVFLCEEHFKARHQVRICFVACRACSKRQVLFSTAEKWPYDSNGSSEPVRRQFCTGSQL